MELLFFFFNSQLHLLSQCTQLIFLLFNHFDFGLNDVIFEFVESINELIMMKLLLLNNIHLFLVFLFSFFFQFLKLLKKFSSKLIFLYRSIFLIGLNTMISKLLDYSCTQKISVYFLLSLLLGWRIFCFTLIFSRNYLHRITAIKLLWSLLWIIRNFRVRNYLRCLSLFWCRLIHIFLILWTNLRLILNLWKVLLKARVFFSLRRSHRLRSLFFLMFLFFTLIMCITCRLFCYIFKVFLLLLDRMIRWFCLALILNLRFIFSTFIIIQRFLILLI